MNDDTSKKEQNDEFFFNPRENRFVTPASADGKTPAATTRTAPSMRLNLNIDFFKNKILNAPAGSLTNNDVFMNYFKGLYFKVEQSGSDKYREIIRFYKTNKFQNDQIDYLQKIYTYCKKC